MKIEYGGNAWYLPEPPSHPGTPAEVEEQGLAMVRNQWREMIGRGVWALRPGVAEIEGYRLTQTNALTDIKEFEPFLLEFLPADSANESSLALSFYTRIQQPPQPRAAQ